MAKTRNKLPVASPSTDVTEAKESPQHEARERQWKAEEALRTIEKAEQHKRDKSLMKDVKAMAREKIKNLDKIK